MPDFDNNYLIGAQVAVEQLERVGHVCGAEQRFDALAKILSPPPGWKAPSGKWG